MLFNVLTHHCFFLQVCRPRHQVPGHGGAARRAQARARREGARALAADRRFREGRVREQARGGGAGVVAIELWRAQQARPGACRGRASSARVCPCR